MQWCEAGYLWQDDDWRGHRVLRREHAKSRRRRLVAGRCRMMPCSGAVRVCAGLYGAAQAKVGHFCDHVIIQENVQALYVPMHVSELVQIPETTRALDRQPCRRLLMEELARRQKLMNVCRLECPCT